MEWIVCFEINRKQSYLNFNFFLNLLRYYYDVFLSILYILFTGVRISMCVCERVPQFVL